MTENEAYAILHPDTASEKLAEIEYYAGFKGVEAGLKAIEDACIIACDAMVQLALYEEIGTVKECKEAVERMKPKKVLYRKQNYGTPWLCPECEADQIKCEFFSEDGSEPQEKHTYCWSCGTVIDWSE